MSQAAEKAAMAAKKAVEAAEKAVEEVRCLSVMRSGCDVQCRMMIEGCAFDDFETAHAGRTPGVLRVPL